MKQRILIVEDNVVLSQLQKKWLERSGYDVVTTMNEPIARKLMGCQDFDLSFLIYVCRKVVVSPFWNGLISLKYGFPL